jgi:hypothetical protein
MVRVALPEPEDFDYARNLWVPEEINAQIERIEDRPKIRSVLQRFISGMYVTGSLIGDPKSLHPDFERLENLPEVWVMCFRAPKSEQWRLMGRFVEFNQFVGLGLFRRQFLDGTKHYHRQAQNFVTHWAQTSGRVPVHVGRTIEEYMSQPVKDPYAPNVI